MNVFSGCGTGLVGDYMIKENCAFGHIDGIDRSPKMIEVASKKNIYRNVILKDMSNLSASSTLYDAVVLFCIFGGR